MQVQSLSKLPPQIPSTATSGNSPSKGESIVLFIAGVALLSYGTGLTFRDGKTVWPQIHRVQPTLESVRKTAALIAPLLPGVGLMAVGTTSVNASSEESCIKKVGRVALFVLGVALMAMGLYAAVEMGKEVLPMAKNGWARNRPSWSFELPFRTEPFRHNGQLCNPPSPLEKKIFTIIATPCVATFYTFAEFGIAMIAGILFFLPMGMFVPFGGPGFAAAYYSVPNKDN